jgi:hypothetical protein
MSVGEAIGADRSGEAGSAAFVAGLLTVCADRFGLDDGGLEWGRLDGRGLRTAAEELGRAIAALAHQQRRVLCLIDERKAYTADGSRDAADWAAGRLGVSRRAAVDEIEVARRLESLPALAAAAAAGELSPEQAKPAVAVADAATDAAWADAAPTMGVGSLQRRAGRARRPAAADHTAARAARIFESWTTGQELRFKGSVPVDDGAKLLKAIERSMPARDPQHPATLGQRHADGLLALASTTVAEDADPDRATVVLVAELAAVCDDDPTATAELETAEPLATETARRLICDSRLSVLVQDRDGRPVGIGSTARTVPPALRRALIVRDGRCRFGDCTARRFLHAHHIEHWPAPTQMSNLALVCYQHHHALHEGAWNLTGDPHSQLTAVHPDGRTSPPNWPHHHPRALGPPDENGRSGTAAPAATGSPPTTQDGPVRSPGAVPRSRSEDEDAARPSLFGGDPDPP